MTPLKLSYCTRDVHASERNNSCHCPIQEKQENYAYVYPCGSNYGSSTLHALVYIHVYINYIYSISQEFLNLYIKRKLNEYVQYSCLCIFMIGYGKVLPLKQP